MSRTRFGREGSRRASAIGRVMATDDKTSPETADDGSNNESKKEEATSSDIVANIMTRMRRRMFGGYISHHASFGILERVERQGDRNDDAVSMIANPSIFHRIFSRSLVPARVNVAAAMVPLRPTPRRMELEHGPLNGKLHGLTTGESRLRLPVKD